MHDNGRIYRTIRQAILQFSIQVNLEENPARIAAMLVVWIGSVRPPAWGIDMPIC